MKRKIFTLLLSAFLGTMVMAQAPSAIIKKATVAPIIDGEVDDVWADANIYNIALPFQTTTPTLGDEGTTTWKGLWTDEGIYILVEVNDDEFYAGYMNNDGATYNYDGLELYFNVNPILVDGAKIGGHGGGQAGKYQIAPAPTAANIGGEVLSDANGMFSLMVTGPTYLAEYFVPFTRFKDKDGGDVDITQPIGFDVTINDGESAAPGVRQRAVWANDGNGPAANESWNDMDDCGTITLSDWDGAVIAKVTTHAPALDGLVDDVWASAPVYNIDKPFTGETPTLGASGETTWQALWGDDGIFVLVKVTDDDFYPAYMNSTDAASWNYDQVEVYFDVNAEKKDAVGSSGNKGHYQFAPPPKEATIDGTVVDESGVLHAYKVTAPNYVFELFVPFSKLVDAGGAEVNKANPIGFDVCIIDNDHAISKRHRAVWTNDGTGPGKNENYGNMDDAGLVKMADATSYDEVESITVTGGSITTDGGTLQMVAAVLPITANPNVKWVVENGTGRATIDGKGVLTGVVDGAVLVKAVSKDGLDTEGKATITISNQITTLSEISIISNGNFDKGADGKQDWTAGTVADGWLTMECTPKVNIWDNMTQTTTKIKDAETKYIVKFKAYASVDMVVPFVQEDNASGHANNKTLTSLSPYRGTENWQIPVTTEPQWFELDVIHSAWVEDAVYQISFQLGMNEGTFYVDSVMMYDEADLALITSVRTLSNVNKVKLYPNPVQNELTVSKIAVANSKVSVYNAVGQRLMEKTANGTQAKFDVANLRKGMYFVRFTDGSSQKFIKQ